MWFSNLLVYRLTQPLQLEQASLDQALASKPARPCASQELSTYGFIDPCNLKAKENTQQVFSLWSGHYILIATRREERILPSGVVRDELDEKVEAIETAQSRKVYKKERDQMKDEVIQTLLPRAFIRRSTTFA